MLSHEPVCRRSAAVGGIRTTENRGVVWGSSRVSRRVAVSTSKLHALALALASPATSLAPLIARCILCTHAVRSASRLSPALGREVLAFPVTAIPARWAACGGGEGGGLVCPALRFPLGRRCVGRWNSRAGQQAARHRRVSFGKEKGAAFLHRCVLPESIASDSRSRGAGPTHPGRYTAMLLAFFGFPKQ